MNDIVQDLCDQLVDICNLYKYPVSIEKNKSGHIEIEFCPELFFNYGWMEMNWSVLYLPFVYDNVSVICLPAKK